MLPSPVRYQVFVSSTFHDLIDERREVIHALLELDCIPAGMELFPASDDDSWSLIRKEIGQSDYYILIIGGRYGSVDEEGISYTEREYDFAMGQGVPILAFLHGNPDEIPAGKSELDERPRAMLDAFRLKVGKAHAYKKWTTAEQLGSVVSRSLVKLAKANPQTGWIRGDEAATPELLQELADLRRENSEMRSIATSRTLSNRRGGRLQCLPRSFGAGSLGSIDGSDRVRRVRRRSGRGFGPWMPATSRATV